MKRKEGPPFPDPVEPDSESLDPEVQSSSPISNLGELRNVPSGVSGKAPEFVVYKTPTPGNSNSSRRRVRGRGKTSPESKEEEVPALPSFSASAEVAVDQPASEFTGAAFKNLSSEQERVTLSGNIPDSGPKTDSLAEVRSRLQNLVKQAGQSNDAVVSPVGTLEKQSSPEEMRVQELEVQLREQTKKFYSKENRLFRLGHGELRKTEQAYNQSLVELAKSKKSSGELNGLEIVNEVLRKGVEAKRQARTEAMSADDRYAFEKALSLIPLGSKWLDTHLGKNKARAARALATAVVVVGGGAALGAFGTASIGALLGYGTYKFARTFGSALVGAAATKASGNFLDRMLGRTQVKATEELSKLSLEGEPDPKVFEEMRIKIEKLVEKADDKTRERKKLIYQALIAMGVGGSVSGLVTLFDIDLPFGGSSTNESNVEKTAAVQQPAQPLRVETVEPAAPPAPAGPVESGPVQPEEQPVQRAPKPESVRAEPAPVQSETPVEHAADSVQEDGSGMTTAELNRASLAEAEEAVASLETQEVTAPEPIAAEVVPEPVTAEAEAPIAVPLETPLPEETLEVRDAVVEAQTLAVEESGSDTEEPETPEQFTPTTVDANESPVERPSPSIANEAVAPTVAAQQPESLVQEGERGTSESEAPVAREMSPFTNMHNLSIDPRVPEVFTNADGTITAYGGTFVERFDAAQDYAQEHPGKVVHLEASRALRGEDGVLRPWITRVIVDPNSMQMTADASPAGAQFIGSPDPQTFTAIAR